jgi:hypothetical protein
VHDVAEDHHPLLGAPGRVSDNEAEVARCVAGSRSDLHARCDVFAVVDEPQLVRQRRLDGGGVGADELAGPVPMVPFGGADQVSGVREGQAGD